jgi:hypothetical protein
MTRGVAQALTEHKAARNRRRSAALQHRQMIVAIYIHSERPPMFAGEIN